MKCVTVGPKGSFCHQAVLTFAKRLEVVFATSIGEVFFRLAEKNLAYGLIPLHSTLSGFYQDGIINLMKYDFPICERIDFQATYHLVGKGEIEEAQALFCDANTFTLCQDRLKAHEIDSLFLEVPTDIHAAMQIQFDREGKALALVSPLTAKLYHLPILEQHLEGDKSLILTFFLIGKTPTNPTGKDRSSFLIFSEPLKAVENQIRSLVETHKIEVLQLENLLLQEGQTPLYFMEISGHLLDPKVKELFALLNEKFLVKPLGSYPQ
jgi:chorismate mutase/prephenate dehydratase